MASAMTTTATAGADSVPPPGYTPVRPQIIVAPLPDAATFFHDQSVQGEVFVKGLGQGGPSKGVRQLSVELSLSNVHPGQAPLTLYESGPEVVWPGVEAQSRPQASSATASTQQPFPTVHRFHFDLAPIHQHGRGEEEAGPSRGAQGVLPGTLNLSAQDRGEIKWSLRVRLQLDSPNEADVVEDVMVEGTPYAPGSGAGAGAGADAQDVQQVEAHLDRKGVRARLVIEDGAPRLGSLLRLGVEVRPKEREKTGVVGLSAQPDPAATLRPLRRVWVELFRRVQLHAAADPSGPSSSTAGAQHLTLLRSSGKSLRYPGRNSQHPPLRLLFTLPTSQVGSNADQSYGEISMTAPYHTVTFFVRVTVGFSGTDAPLHPSAAGGDRDGAGGDWVIEREIEIRPRVWEAPRPTTTGTAPALSAADMQDAVSLDGLSEGEVAREEYRRKGLDVVGASGTYRADQALDDRPPTFEEAGPSNYDFHSTLEGDARPPSSAALSSELPLPPPAAEMQLDTPSSSRLPTFMESEAATAGLHRLAAGQPEAPFDRNTSVGRRGSLKGELSTWLEYDGYETFSVAPPSVSASFGASGSMDPPQPEDEDVGVVQGMAVRLGLGPEHVGGVGRAELMEHLGLGEGTRVIDLQDDLPPGIDEPSLPALPDFSAQPYRPRAASHPRGSLLPLPDTVTPEEGLHDVSPPSFAASEAAQAVGGVAMGGMRRSASGSNAAALGGSVIPGVAGLTVPLGGGIALAPRGSVHHSAACTPPPPPPPLTDEPPPPIADLTTPPPSLPEHESRGAPPGYEGHAGPAGGPPAYS